MTIPNNLLDALVRPFANVQGGPVIASDLHCFFFDGNKQTKSLLVMTSDAVGGIPSSVNIELSKEDYALLQASPQTL